MNLYYSFIIPVYNRPDEIGELLSCFEKLETGLLPFEIIIVEDGSDNSCLEVVSHFKDHLPISYYFKENSGPGDSRNYGMERAKGNYFIILDSDVLLPTTYLKEVDKALTTDYTDCFGGPDAAHPDFTPIQKAINFSMTSFLTTGGIRGKGKSVEKFKPRSFNMGISKKAFKKTGGFAKIRVGEDLDMSIRLAEKGFEIQLISEAFVYHKRRNTWKSFYRQVHKFGMGRPILNHWYPKTFSPFFLLPSVFIIGLGISLILFVFKVSLFLWFYLFYFLLIFVVSSIFYKNPVIGLYSLWAVLVQFTGYGFGYMKSAYYITICKKEPREAFPELFFE